MKKYIYILLLMLIVPTVAFADCASDIDKNKKNIQTRYDNLSQHGCYVVTSVGSDPGSSACLADFGAFEGALADAMIVYNTCKAEADAESYYTYIYEYVTKYNALPSNRRFNYNTRNACGSAFKEHLEKLESNKGMITSVVNNQHCSEGNASDTCKQAFDSYKNLLSKSLTLESTYNYSTCDVRKFHEDWQQYVSFYNSTTSGNYDPTTYNDSQCMKEVQTALDKLSEYKGKIVGVCDKTVDNLPEGCDKIIKSFKELLDKVYKKKNAGDFSDCKTYVKLDDQLAQFQSYYNMLPYVSVNDLRYTPPDPIAKEVKKDPVFCPLGSDVTKDLVGVLRLMKIAAPILVLAYTVYEVIQALTKGEMESKSKEIFQKFGKRCAAAIILFAIPVLVDAGMQLLNVWDETGRCVLTDTEDTTEVVTSKQEESSN